MKAMFTQNYHSTSLKIVLEHLNWGFKSTERKTQMLSKNIMKMKKIIGWNMFFFI